MRHFRFGGIGGWLLVQEQSERGNRLLVNPLMKYTNVRDLLDAGFELELG